MVSSAVFVLGCLVTAAVDARTFRIPGALLAGFLCLLVLGRLADGPAAAFAVTGAAGIACAGALRLAGPGRLLAALFSFAALYVPFRRGGSGFGDAKYAALLGYALDLRGAVPFLAGSALACVLGYTAGRFLFRWDRNLRLPFAPFLSLGAIAAVILGGQL